MYDGGLIDTLPESDVEQYLRTMELLRRLEVDVVYPGHGRPFDRTRLREIAEAYLRERGELTAGRREQGARRSTGPAARPVNRARTR